MAIELILPYLPVIDAKIFITHRKIKREFGKLGFLAQCPTFVYTLIVSKREYVYFIKNALKLENEKTRNTFFE